MPFQRDELPELVERTRADLKSRLGIAGAIVRRSVANILATVWAGAVHLAYGMLDWLARQLFVDTADRDQLIRQGELYGLAPTAATFADGTVTATGTDTTVIPLGTVFVRDDDERFESTAAVAISGTTATVPVQAVAAGAAGNTEAGATLNLESPIAGINAATTVDPGDGDGIDGGVDEEETEAFRERLEEFFASSPAGGSDSDYEKWAKKVAGVTRVWVQENSPLLGQVTVLFVRDGESPIFPDVGEVTAVQDYLDTLRPATAEVIAAAPVELSLGFVLSITPDTPENRVAVEAELDDLVTTQGEAGDGAGRGTIFLSQIYGAISRAPVTDFTVTSPVADTVPNLGELVTRGTVVFS